MTAAQILVATDERIIELGSEGAQRLVAGKSENKEASIGNRLLILKQAYINAELNPKEKESILYCLIKVSGKFDVAAITNSGGLGIGVSPGVDDIFFIGIGDDISHYFGSSGDISGFI